MSFELIKMSLELIKMSFLFSFMNNESHLPCVRDQSIGPKQDSQNQKRSHNLEGGES